MNREQTTGEYPIEEWVGPDFAGLGIFVLCESWYGDFSKELVTDDGYIRAYLANRVTDALYTRIAHGAGMTKATFWPKVMFTNYVQRVGPTRDYKPTTAHYKAAEERLHRLLREHLPKGVWIVGKGQSEYSEPIVRSVGIPVEVVNHPASYGVKTATLRESWEKLLAKVAPQSKNGT